MTYRILTFFALILAVSSPAQAATYPVKGDIVGREQQYKAQEGETLHDIARKFDLGIVELKNANPHIFPSASLKGQRLRIPTLHKLPPEIREGIVINLAERRLYYFPNPETVMTFPVGIGKEGWETPDGATTIIRKRKDPAWIPPASIHKEVPDLPDIILPGPDNPLGGYALNLGLPGIIIHGTNNPRSIGSRASHGCIRLYPEDIEALFEKVLVGTKVTIMQGKLGDAARLSLQNAEFMLEESEKEAFLILVKPPVQAACFNGDIGDCP